MAGTAGLNDGNANGGVTTMSRQSAWPTERWAAVITIGALGALIALRMGFRGIGPVNIPN